MPPRFCQAPKLLPFQTRYQVLPALLRPNTETWLPTVTATGPVCSTPLSGVQAPQVVVVWVHCRVQSRPPAT
jgi:hypothetical protein